MTYITKSGEYWDQIAKKLYGDERLMTVLIEKNPTLADIFIFDSGVKIEYEELTASDTSTKPVWRT